MRVHKANTFVFRNMCVCVCVCQLFFEKTVANIRLVAHEFWTVIMMPSGL